MYGVEIAFLGIMLIKLIAYQFHDIMITVLD